MVVETWKSVVGFEMFYKVSNLGGMRARSRTTTQKGDHRRGDFVVKRPGKRLKPQRDKKGRMVIPLNMNGRMKLCKVHRLVLEAFVGPCPDGMECRHLNGKSDDNRLENLAWGTHVENCKDRDRHGTTARGNTSGVAKITENDARQIHAHYATGKFTYGQLAKMFNISTPCIARILTGDGFKHLGLPVLVQPAPRGRSPRNRGQTHGNAKFTDDDVRELRRDYDAGVSAKVLGERYGVHHKTITAIGKRKYWKHVE